MRKQRLVNRNAPIRLPSLVPKRNRVSWLPYCRASTPTYACCCSVCIVMARVTLLRAEGTFLVFLVLAPVTWSLHRVTQLGVLRSDDP
jgi:hypothetical protein